MRRVAVAILGGGRGSRLFPLTLSSCKPYLSYGGRYRLIDIPISNALNSGCHQIFVLTQFLSSTLYKHIVDTYQFGTCSPGFVHVLSAEEKPHKKEWFQGTADAVRQSLHQILETPSDYIMILSGDQIYHIDFGEMLKTALNTDADLTIACLATDEKQAKRMGVAQIDKQSFITHFHEKPQSSEELLPLQQTGSTSYYIASMGIYLFKRQSLIKLLEQDTREDFGKHLIPTQVAMGGVAAHLHRGYWEDIGTIDAFYQANIALTKRDHPFTTCNEEWPIYVKPSFLPAARIHQSHIDQSLICEGGMIEHSTIVSSLIGPRTVIGQDSILRSTYVLGNDTYEDLAGTPFSIGSNCTIEQAIIDKHVTIGNDVKLVNENGVSEADFQGVFIRNGIIVVPQGTHLPDHFTLRVS